MKTYYPTIGLEIHAEMSTDTKMFCKCANNPFEATPNTHTCPVCMAHPGSLPVPNQEAIENMIRIGLAVDGKIANFTEFDRKNYFYPDIPKGWQISQYKHPIVSGGILGGVKLTRIHLEEDTATSKHGEDGTLVDYNRAGVPLMELVTEPVIHTSQEAIHFAKELQLLLRYLGVSHANLEKGEMRVEVNVSISDDPEKLGTKVEVKNIASFAMAGKAIDYEVARMADLLEAGRGDEIIQETRGWDDEKGQTFSQRTKENSEDYRYFPEPDIPKFYLHELYNLEEKKAELPELPWERRSRYEGLGLTLDTAEVLIQDQELGSFFENTVIVFSGDEKKIQLAANYLVSDLVGLMKNDEEGRLLLKRLNADAFAELISMTAGGDINSRATKDILAMLVKEGGDPRTIAETQGLLQENDIDALRAVAQSILDENPQAVEDYKAGKETSIKFLVGQAMKATKGSANPQTMEELYKEIIG
ncbi:Asp-tRNA(Asn)/Glu-tRNA(Gln) amidotransferase subunit GatB [Candidatus Nomurabacteria bacterium]|nr:Asp-tRNA(Asn)/Glu-tRNA(Gln) amidotransferase subunit GatB [Candidatus Nomurabacteria bacterium]